MINNKKSINLKKTKAIQGKPQEGRLISKVCNL
jgi:hypothetical protein